MPRQRNMASAIWMSEHGAEWKLNISFVLSFRCPLSSIEQCYFNLYNDSSWMTYGWLRQATMNTLGDGPTSKLELEVTP
jgi:hypothetical protein